MAIQPIIKRGTPPSLWASRLIFAAALLLGAVPAFAEGPEPPVGQDWLAKADTALQAGSDDATLFAARALKAAPKSAPENRQMALSLFWAGHFEDSARHMRRALATDPNVLMEQPRLGQSMPVDTARERLKQLAPDAENDSELCFLVGALLMLDQDRPRALAFLIRAEELAGTDGQAGALIDQHATDRNQLRGEVAMQEGDWEDAVRSFVFAALDAPAVTEHYAGLALALAATGDDAMALKMASHVYSRFQRDSLMPWLQSRRPHGNALSDAAKRLLAAEGAGGAHYRLAATLFLASGWYASAHDAGIKALLVNKLDEYIHDLQGWMEQRKLKDDPPGAGKPANPEPELPVPDDTPAEEAPSLEGAAKLIRRGEYTQAYKMLDSFLTDDAELQVYHLLFVALVGRGELPDAAAALQTWFLKAPDAQRTKLNSMREMFGTRELFQAWRDKVLVVRDATPNSGLPRLINCYVELTCGRYNAARDELVVARIESPGNAMVLTLTRILEAEDFQKDRTPDGVLDDPTPKAIMARADREFRAGKYEAAKSAYLEAAEADATLPYLTIGLMRCYFALADYDAAHRQLGQLFTEQGMADKQPREFQLLLEAGYDKPEVFRAHLDTLKAECESRPLSTTPWSLYGMILLARSENVAARDALQVWYDNAPGTRDPILVKFYEYARKRAS